MRVIDWIAVFRALFFFALLILIPLLVYVFYLKGNGATIAEQTLREEILDGAIIVWGIFWVLEPIFYEPQMHTPWPNWFGFVLFLPLGLATMTSGKVDRWPLYFVLFLCNAFLLPFWGMDMLLIAWIMAIILFIKMRASVSTHKKDTQQES
ncbi:MAG: hypothetical protein GWN86_15230 [Desulfobacterales bacterium]|nr:hypothetical protein [Desulfobacterales bacterium]